MILYRFIILLFLSGVLIRCSGNSSCNQVKLLQHEKRWFNFYSVRDSLIFGNSNTKLGFIVKSKSHDFTACNRFELGPNEYEFLGTTLKSNSFKIRIIFTKEYQNESELNCIKEIRISDLHTSKLTDLEVLKKEDIFVPFLNRKETTYLITSDTLTTDIDGGIQAVKSFNWSERYGVVRYTRYTNEVFDLVEKK